jgi:hypothetical protein
MESKRVARHSWYPDQRHLWLSCSRIDYQAGDGSIDDLEFDRHLLGRNLGSISSGHVGVRQGHPGGRHRQFRRQPSLAKIDLHQRFIGNRRRVYADELRPWRKLQRFVPVGRSKQTSVGISPTEVLDVHAEST